MTVIKARNFKGEKNYSIFHHEPFEFQSPLSCKARGLLATALSQAEVWEFRLDHLAKTLPDKKDAIRTGFNELETHGYLVRRISRNEKGQYDSDYVFFGRTKDREEWEDGLTPEEKAYWFPQKPTEAENPTRCKNQSGFPDADDPIRGNQCGKPDLITSNKVTTINQTNINQTNIKPHSDAQAHTRAHDLNMSDFCEENQSDNHGTDKELNINTVDPINSGEDQFSAPRTSELVPRTQDPILQRQNPLVRQREQAMKNSVKGSVFGTVEKEREFFREVQAYKMALDPKLSPGEAERLAQGITNRVRQLRSKEDWENLAQGHDLDLVEKWRNGELAQYKGATYSKAQTSADKLRDSIASNPLLEGLFDS